MTESGVGEDWRRDTNIKDYGAALNKSLFVRTGAVCGRMGFIFICPIYLSIAQWNLQKWSESDTRILIFNITIISLCLHAVSQSQCIPQQQPMHDNAKWLTFFLPSMGHFEEKYSSPKSNHRSRRRSVQYSVYSVVRGWTSIGNHCANDRCL